MRERQLDEYLMKVCYELQTMCERWKQQVAYQTTRMRRLSAFAEHLNSLEN